MTWVATRTKPHVPVSTTGGTREVQLGRLWTLVALPLIVVMIAIMILIVAAAILLAGLLSIGAVVTNRRAAPRCLPPHLGRSRPAVSLDSSSRVSRKSAGPARGP